MNRPDGLAELTRATARTAAEFVRAHRPPGRVAVAATKSSDTDVVTEIDRACEQLIRTAIGAARPDDAILGEEGGTDSGTSGVTWIVDPIDGTVNFVHGLPGYSVSIAAAVDGVVETGCVVDVLSGEEFAAVRGGGAVVVTAGEERPLGPPVDVPLDKALIGTGFNYEVELRVHQGEAISRMLGSIADIRRIGSAAVDLCSVAAGRLDGYVEQGLKPWDLAAGELIAAESGIVVQGLDGAANERLTVACPPSLSVELMALVRRVGL